MKRKAESLLKRLHRLQSSIYDFCSELEDKGYPYLSELASESAFELDVSQSKMNEIINAIETSKPTNP
jgi:hypothetical protein